MPETEQINKLIFYSIEKTIKVYRQFAQKELIKANLPITVDQWLTLKGLSDQPQLNQKELAQLVFKDAASITRILDILEKGGFIKRVTDIKDRRNTKLLITKTGKAMVRKTQKTVLKYRNTALHNISTEKISQIQSVLQTIILNCK